MKKWIYGIVLFLCITGCAKTDAPPQSTISNQSEFTPVKAPSFYVFDEEGEKVTLDDFPDQPIVLNFWASWCSGCVAELDEFENAYQENEDVVFMMINVTDGDVETKESAKNYTTQNNYTFPVYYDQTGSSIHAFQIDAIPVTVFINKDKTINSTYYGPISDKKLKAQIQLLTD